MIDKKQENFLIFLRLLSKKGFYEILKYVQGEKNVHYNQVKKYAIESGVVDSNASITIILNGLTHTGLLKRTVLDKKPVRTVYSLSPSGTEILKKLKDLEKYF